jgi:hypothetical protein
VVSLAIFNATRNPCADYFRADNGKNKIDSFFRRCASFARRPRIFDVHVTRYAKRPRARRWEKNMSEDENRRKKIAFIELDAHMLAPEANDNDDLDEQRFNDMLSAVFGGQDKIAMFVGFLTSLYALCISAKVNLDKSLADPHISEDDRDFYFYKHRQVAMFLSFVTVCFPEIVTRTTTTIKSTVMSQQ